MTSIYAVYPTERREVPRPPPVQPPPPQPRGLITPNDISPELKSYILQVVFVMITMNMVNQIANLLIEA
mgnify:CR=1 FL=1